MGPLITFFLAAVSIIILVNSVKIVREYKRLVVFRLGRSVGQKGPGIVFLIPILDQAISVDLRDPAADLHHEG
jgi:regulator of protease activity HflC (stomatin/prohibitin superfamily)